MFFDIKKLLINKEVLFNSFGQIIIKKRLIFNLTFKFFRFIPNKF